VILLTRRSVVVNRKDSRWENYSNTGVAGDHEEHEGHEAICVIVRGSRIPPEDYSSS
jgi:hypothetical protein